MPAISAAAARFIVVVDLPTPPFKFVTAMTLDVAMNQPSLDMSSCLGLDLSNVNNIRCVDKYTHPHIGNRPHFFVAKQVTAKRSEAPRVSAQPNTRKRVASAPAPRRGADCARTRSRSGSAFRPVYLAFRSCAAESWPIAFKSGQKVGFGSILGRAGVAK